MAALDTFSRLVGFIPSIPKLVKLNAAQRQDTRDAVGFVADELNRGLELVFQRIAAARVLASSKKRGAQREVVKYLQDSTGGLFASFSEFKICRGLRERRDHFNQLFHPARAAVRTANLGKVTQLLEDLEDDEAMIIDEVGPILDGLQQDAAHSLKRFRENSEVALKQIRKRQARVKRLARKVHEVL